MAGIIGRVVGVRTDPEHTIYDIEYTYTRGNTPTGIKNRAKARALAESGFISGERLGELRYYINDRHANISDLLGSRATVENFDVKKRLGPKYAGGKRLLTRGKAVVTVSVRD